MGMTQERIKECIKLLETDGINSKAMVLEILKKELVLFPNEHERKIDVESFYYVRTLDIPFNESSKMDNFVLRDVKESFFKEIAPKIMVTRKEVRYGTEYSVSLQYFIENEE